MSLETEIRGMLKDVVREVVREELGSRSESSDENEMLTYAMAATRVKVSASTIKRWVKVGKLKTYGSGKLRRVRPADVRACLEAEEKEPLTAPDFNETVRSIVSTVRR